MPSAKTSPAPSPEKIVTQRDIARQCGLHQSAISFALRGDTRHVTTDTIARVRQVAEQLGYAPHQGARKMAAMRFGTKIVNRLIALCFPRDFHRNPYFLEPYLGAMDALTTAGFDLLTLRMPDDLPADFLANSPTIASGNVDAIIAFSVPDHIHRLLKQARALPAFGARPFIALIQPMQDCSTVIYNDEQAAYELGCHLLALGHRHILAFMVPYALDIWQRRLAGFQRAYRDYGVESASLMQQLFTSDTCWIDPSCPTEALQQVYTHHTTDIDYHSGVTFTDYLRAHPELTAVAAWNDVCARHIWRLAEGLGWRVPADLSITGFDDDEILLDQSGHKQLTTIRLPQQHLGATAVQLAVARVNDEITNDQHLLLPGALMARISTGAPVRVS